MQINEILITYMGQPARVNCDRNCAKAWGRNNRPYIESPDNIDIWIFLADGELGSAPVNPGTYEGIEGKPLSPDEFPTKWCVRECERCAKSGPGEWMDPLPLIDFSERVI